LAGFASVRHLPERGHLEPLSQPSGDGTLPGRRRRSRGTTVSIELGTLSEDAGIGNATAGRYSRAPPSTLRVRVHIVTSLFGPIDEFTATNGPLKAADAFVSRGSQSSRIAREGKALSSMQLEFRLCLFQKSGLNPAGFHSNRGKLRTQRLEECSGRRSDKQAIWRERTTRDRRHDKLTRSDLSRPENILIFRWAGARLTSPSLHQAAKTFLPDCR